MPVYANAHCFLRSFCVTTTDFVYQLHLYKQVDEDKAKAAVAAAGGGGGGWKLPELQDSSQLRCTRLPDPQTPSKVGAK